MNGSRLTDCDTTSTAASVATILGVKGTLRFRPHGSTQKAHVVLRRVVLSECSNGNSTPQHTIRFSLFAAKRIEVKPGKEILLTVASEDGQFKDQPIILEGDTLGAPSETDEEDVTQVADEEEFYIPPSEAIIPPKLRRDWTKKPEDIIPIPPLPTYHSIGVQMEPMQASAAIQTEQQCYSISTQTEYQTISSSVQTENNSTSSSVQTENNTLSSLVQTESNSVSSSAQTYANSVSAIVQTESNSVCTSIQTENTLSSSSAQIENMLALCSVQTESNTAYQPIQPHPLFVSAQDANILATEKSTRTERSLSPMEFDSDSDSASQSHYSPPHINILSATGTYETTRKSYPRLPDVPAWLLPDQEVENKYIPTSDPLMESQKTSNITSNGWTRSDPYSGVSPSASQLYTSELYSTTNAVDAANKADDKPHAPEHSASISSHLSHTPSVTPLHPTIPQKRTSDEQQGITSSSKSYSNSQSSSVPTAPRWLLSQGALSDPTSSSPEEKKSSSPPPDPRSLIQLSSGPSANPLGIRPSAPVGLNKVPPIGPRAFVQAYKPVVVGNGWSATRARGPPKGPTALVSIVPKDDSSDANKSTGSVVSKATPSTAINASSSSSSTPRRFNPDNSVSTTSTGRSRVSGFQSSTSSAGSPFEPKCEASLVNSASYLLPTSQSAPVPTPPSIPPPPPPADPAPPVRSLSPPWKRAPPQSRWKKVGNQPPPVPQSKAPEDNGLDTFEPRCNGSSELLQHSATPNGQPSPGRHNLSPIKTTNISARSSPTPTPSCSEPPSKKFKSQRRRALLRQKDMSAHNSPSPITPTTPTTAVSSLPSVPQPLNHPLPPKPSQPMGQPPLSQRERGPKRARPLSPEPLARPRKRKRIFRWPTIETSDSVSLQGEGDVAARAVTFSTDGSHFAVTCADCSLRIWNSKSRHEIARLSRDAMVLGVAWMDGGSGVVVLTEDGLVGKYTRNGSAWQWTKMLDIGMEAHSDEEPICFAYMRDRIAISFPHSGVKVWLWQRGAWCPQRSIVRQNVSAIRFIDGGDAIIGGTKDGVLWYCEVPNGTLRAYAFLKTKIVSVDVDHTGTHVLVGDKNGCARLVPLRQSYNKDAELTYSCEEMIGSQSCNLPSLFATKGQAVLCGNVDECVLVWDKKKASVVYGLEHPEDDHIRTIACFDGNTTRPGFIITGTKQGLLCWWPLPISAS